MPHRRWALVLGLSLTGVVAPAVVDPVGVRAAAVCAVGEHEGGEWRRMGGDVAGTRSQPLETVIGVEQAPSLEPTWSFDLAENSAGGGVTGTPVVADGCTFVGTGSGDVFALNADTGELVWRAKVPSSGAINSTLAVEGGLVFAFVSKTSSPYAVAFDQATGALVWETVLDTQVGSDSYSSPVVFDGLVFAGVSGGAAEVGDEADRYAFQGSYVLLDALSGAVVKKGWTIHEPAADGVGDGYAGAAVWSTPAVDVETGFAYVGTGNPFQPQKEHAHANAVIKVDLRRDSPTFGEIVGSYKGDVDEFFPAMSELPCGDVEGNPPPWYPQGVGACADIDLDFGASPNLFAGPGGRKLVGDGQKSGVYHAFDADTMAGEWKQQLGPPSLVGGIVGSAAVTGGGVAGPVTQGGYLWSLGREDGAVQWLAPTADGAHYAHQTTHANGVVYTMDLKGFLDAYDAASGTPLLHTPVGPMEAAVGGLGGGVAVARNTVYAPANGVVTAFRLAAGGGGGPVPVPAPVPVPEPPVGAPEGTGPVITTLPGGFIHGYAPPAVVVQKGGSLTYANVDVAPHDVISDAVGPGDQPWCVNYLAGRCPLIWSNLISLGTTTPVYGLENVTPGSTYEFTCSLHPNMRGTLVVSPV